MEYIILYDGAEAEEEVKKSKFIAATYPINSEDKALKYIADKKKECRNASHNCYAYVLGANMELQRFSDDGEPQGTAGKPILDVLLGREVHDALIIVTRYFGGTLLGTGGLIRAYTGAAKAGLEKSMLVTKYDGKLVKIDMEYTDLGKVQYIIGNAGITPSETVYENSVSISLFLSDEEIRKLKNELTESSSGRLKMEIIKECRFGIFESVRKEL